MTWNYDRIKREAREQGISIKDLCALAPVNDPFYTGRKSEVAAAEWFADLWRRFGYGGGVHLRRVHYQTQAQEPPVALPTSLSWTDKNTKRKYKTDIYINNDRCWKYLGSAGKWARYLGLVSPGAFVDRRNFAPEVFANWRQWSDPEPRYSIDFSWHWRAGNYELPELPELDELPDSLPDPAEFDVEGYVELLQDYHVELWCEKTTMNDVLIPLCKRYSINYITGKGEMSITSVLDALKRIRKSGRPARILYVSDYDPAGLGMPISVARKVEFFQRNEDYDDLDIRLQPVALTTGQVVEYDLPRKPVEDSRRKDNWEADHGKGQVELDALEALHPGELRRIIETAILGYYDPDLQERADETKDELVSDLDDEREAIVERYQDDLDDLEKDYQALLSDFDETREKFSVLVADFQLEIDAHRECLDKIKERATGLFGDMDAELKAVDLDLDEYALPEPELSDESDDVLYISCRAYLDQMDIYKAHRHGENGQ